MITLSILTGLVFAIATADWCWVSDAYKENCNTCYVQPNFAEMQSQLQYRLYGQHIVLENVVPALEGHWNDPNPKKPLLMTFNGYTASGKDYTSAIIAQNYFKLGEQSRFVHKWDADKLWPDKNQLEANRNDLRQRLDDAKNGCGNSIVIINEVDKMDPQLLQILKQYVDYRENNPYRRFVFILISNYAAEEINAHVAKHNGPRRSLLLRDFQPAIAKAMYSNPGGLHRSELVDKHLIDHYLPYLPLQRRHVMQCVKYYFVSTGEGNNALDVDLVSEIADEFVYFPKENPLFSASGCKKVPAKVTTVLGRRKLLAKEKQEL